MVAEKNDNRGRFRSLTADDLGQVADNPLWYDGEMTKLIYGLPLRRHPWFDGYKSISWTRLARSRGLVDGQPEDELMKRFGFLTATSPHTHRGPYLNAIDFLVSDGATVLASQDGIVIEVIEHNARWGDGPEFADSANLVTIEHADREFTQYIHLAYGSVSGFGLKKFDRVIRGQPIAKVGKTGWTDRDHLHWIAFRGDTRPGNTAGFKSLVPRFRYPF